MFLHVVMLQFNEKADQVFFERIQAYAGRIRNECHSVMSFHFGPNEASRSDGHAHAVVAAFANSAAHDDYQVSPAHTEMKAYMGPFIHRMVVFDGSVPAPVVH